MFKKELKFHFLLVLVWLGLITLLRWSWHWNLIWLWLGGALGFFLINIDHLLYLFFINPHELTSQRARRLWEQRRLKELVDFIFDTQDERTRLAFHNALFQIVLLVFSFFVLTSTHNLFGSGLVMGMALYLLQKELGQWRGGKEEELRQWLFWPFKIEVSFQQQKAYLIFMVLIFIVFNFFLV